MAAMNEFDRFNDQFRETEDERNDRLRAKRIAAREQTRRVTAGPYTLELPANGVAILYEADGAGIDHQLPGGIGHLEALVQFAGEVLRLQAMVDQMRKDRDEQDLAIRDAIREIASR